MELRYRKVHSTTWKIIKGVGYFHIRKHGMHVYDTNANSIIDLNNDYEVNVSL